MSQRHISPLLERGALVFFASPLSPNANRAHKLPGKSATNGVRGSTSRGHGFRKRGRKPRMQALDPFAGPKVMSTQPPSTLKDGTSVLLFRNDLRLRDNGALNLANSTGICVPMFVFDETQFGLDNPSPYGFQRTGPFRAYFLRQAVDDVRDELMRLGSDMLIRIGDPVEEVVEVVTKLLENDLGPVHFVAQKEFTAEELGVERAIEARLLALAESLDAEVSVNWVWGSTLHHLDDLPFNPGGPGVPSTLTAYRKLIEDEEGPIVRDELPVPEQMQPFPLQLRLRNDGLPHLGDDLAVEGVGEPNDYPFPDHRAVMGFVGGPTAGEKRMKEYIWDREGLVDFKETRNDSGTQDFSTKLAPWLALGCVSPRSLYWEAKRFEMKVVDNESTYMLEFGLMTRDYFRWVAASVGSRLFAHNGYSGPGPQPVWTLPAGAVSALHSERLQKWIDGATGAPFVDASMRELKYTGYMSNRGRQNAASFLINDLGFPDWRAGAEYFESMLIDHDVASNWGNWAYIAGVGSDPRGGRRFNVVRQGMQYDETGWFIRGWCQELLRVPAPQIHQPHLMSEAECQQYHLEKGVSYPLPIVPLGSPKLAEASKGKAS